MKLTRRDFMHAGCAAGAATLATSIGRRAKAATGGPPSGNPNRVTLNVSPVSWANLAKGFGFNVPPNIADVNGYPTSTPPENIGANPGWIPGYTGKVVWKWRGRASMQLSPAVIVWSGGRYVNGISPSDTGDTGGNFAIIDKTNPRVVFSFGYRIQHLSQSSALNASGQHVIRLRTKTNFLASYVGGTNTGSISGTTLTTASGAYVAAGLTVAGSGIIAGTRIVSGSGTSWQVNIPQTVSLTALQFAYPGPTVRIADQTGQAAATGTWATHVVDAQNMDLVATAWNPTDPYSGPGGHALTSLNGIDAAYILAQGRFSGFSNLVICKEANESLVDAGQITDPDLINQYKYLMNHETAPFSQRGWLRFMDNSGVQGSYECDFANRMPASYISYANGTNYFLAAYWTGQITNSGGDAYTCSSPPASGSGAYADLEIVQGTFGATNTSANPMLNVGGRGPAPIFDFTTNPYIFRITAPAASAGLKMVWTFRASWLNGGAPYAFTYTTVPGDTASVVALNGNLVNALGVDITLSAAQIRFGNSAQVVAYPRTAQAGFLTIAYLSGPAICTMTRIDPSTFIAGGTATFIYSEILGGWIYRAGGLVVSAPFETIVEMCNQVGAHCWYNWPVHTKSEFITAVTNFFGDATTGLTSGLRFGTEVGNELWNFGQEPFAKCQYLGFAMGFASGSENPQWSWGALRTIQYASLSRAAWTGKGRALEDHYILQMGRQAEAFPGQNFTKNGLEGHSLTTSNSIYATYSGLDGGPGPADYSAYPNRPVDIITATGIASYWYSDWIRETASEIFGTVADNAVWLRASLDYANGLTASAFSALVTMFTTQRPGLNLGQQANWISFQMFFANFESIVAAYDASRLAKRMPKVGIMNYEGAPQWSISNSAINGTNGTGVFWYTDFANQIVALGWNVSAYTASGSNSAAELANQVVNMIQGWKHDADTNETPANTGSYKNMIKQYHYAALVAASAGKNREVKPAQYGYQQNIWGLFPGAYQFGHQYTNYDAIHEFNA